MSTSDKNAARGNNGNEKTVTVYIDGKAYRVSEGKNMLETALNLGFDLPYFCWHPAMGSVGACRQCAVKMFKDENDEKGKIVMACMTPVKEGTRISIDDPEAKEFRASNIEWLMVNHPHDCPVCDEGGECHLQDMTIMSGHVYREYPFPKRTYRNQDLGPFIEHEMNRCITCYRCVRFYQDYAGGHDFGVFGSHDRVYFGRSEDGPLENEFSGNLVEVCPTGVFTDKTLHDHYTRKWDLQTAPSVCTLCGVGCNTIPGERYGKLRRVRNRYHYEINGYFLCDRGRYGYEFVNDGSRPKKITRRSEKGGNSEVISQKEALEDLKVFLSNRERVIGIGSPRASLEANYSLRDLVGPENFSTGLPAEQSKLLKNILEILTKGPVCSPSVKDMENSDAVFILGEDVTNTAPRIALAIRQSVLRKPSKDIEDLAIPSWQDAGIREAVQDAGGPLFIASTASTRLDDVATFTNRSSPQNIARLGFAVAHLIDLKIPKVENLTQEEYLLAETIASDLRSSKHPLIVAGLSQESPEIIRAAADIAFALNGEGRVANLAYVVPESNTVGVAMMGGLDLGEVSRLVREGKADRLVILENDLYGRMKKDDADYLLDSVDVVAMDYTETKTVMKADLTVPTATFAESTGTLVNYEGRAQRYFQVFEATEDVLPAHRWIETIKTSLDSSHTRKNADGILKDLAKEIPIFEPVLASVPFSDFRVHGMKVPRQSPRYSGRTSMHSDKDVNVKTPSEDPDAPMSFSMEGFEGQPEPALIARYWTPGWNSVQALNKFQQEISGPLKGDVSGRRLIEPSDSMRISHFEKKPAVFRAEEGKWLAVPIYHIFGSEPLSMLTPGIARMAPKPYIALNADDAEKLKVSEGDSISIDGKVSLPVKILSSLPVGLAGMPVGVVNLEYFGKQLELSADKEAR